MNNCRLIYINQRKKSIVTAFSILFFFFSSKIDAQSKYLSIKLSDAGFENIRVLNNDKDLFVSLENNIYRWNVTGIKKALEIISENSQIDGYLTLFLLYHGLPQVTLRVPINIWHDFLHDKISSFEIIEEFSATYSIADSWNELKKEIPKNQHLSKFDIIIFPQIKAQFGDLEHMVDGQINIAPMLNVSFWKGMNFSTQVIFPIHNTLNKEGDYIRPGLLTINQKAKLPFNTFASITAGYFTRNRYGIDLETKNYFINDKVSIGVRYGYTGSASILDGRWTYSELNTFTWYADVAYRYAKYNLTLKVGYGSFIAKDKGWRLDVYRQFREVPVGFFVMRSGGVVNGGFNFSIPLPPKKYWKHRIIRLRTASNFAWEYRAKGLPTEGRQYSTGNGLEDYLKTINPDYLKYMITK